MCAERKLESGERQLFPFIHETVIPDLPYNLSGSSWLELDLDLNKGNVTVVANSVP